VNLACVTWLLGTENGTRLMPVCVWVGRALTSLLERCAREPTKCRGLLWHRSDACVVQANGYGTDLMPVCVGLCVCVCVLQISVPILFFFLFCDFFFL
jgi:hypothetical protein